MPALFVPYSFSKSLVQFKVASIHLEKPIIMRFTPSLRRFPNVAFDSVSTSSDVPMIDEGPRSLILLRKVVESFPFPRLSHAGDQWCDGSMV